MHKEKCFNRNFTESLETLNTDNPREFWNKISSMGVKKAKISTIVKKGEQVISNLEDVMSELKNTCSNIYKPNQCHSENLTMLSIGIHCHSSKEKNVTNPLLTLS